MMPAAVAVGSARRPFEEAGPECLARVKAYLECRSRCVEPAAPLSAAWDGFYGFYAPRIRRFLGRWPLSEADRNDCLQDVWHEIVAQLTRFEHDAGRARLSTWMMTLAHNKAVNVIRRQSRHAIESLDDRDVPVATDPRADPAATYERRRTQDEVRGVLDDLAGRVSSSSFLVLYLRWIEGRSTAEVADALELTPQQVRFRTHRMKRKFRELFESTRGPAVAGETRSPSGDPVPAQHPLRPRE